MTGIRLFLALTTLLVAGACTGGGSDPVTSTTSNSGGALSGRIAIVDEQGDIITVDPDGSNVAAITNDGSSVRYFQPVWSPTGMTLAWGQDDPADGSSLGLSEGDGVSRRKVDMDQFPFYFYWSPDGERLGVLHNGTSGGVDFEIVDVGALATSVVDSGSSYYFSWSPDGDAVVVHVDGDRLDIFDESANPTEVGTPSPDFLSPRWTEAGIFFRGERGVVLRRPDGQNVLLGKPAGFATINPSPDGSRVAIHTLGGPPGVTVGLMSQEDPLPPNSVIIVEPTSGASEIAVDRYALVSFWSPDGNRLLMLVPTTSEGDFELVMWEDGESTTLATVRLSAALVREALQYSDQYAQSWQIWSPGSDGFVVPATFEDQAGVWVFPLGSDPVNIGGGTWAAWSHS